MRPPSRPARHAPRSWVKRALLPMRRWDRFSLVPGEGVRTAPAAPPVARVALCNLGTCRTPLRAASLAQQAPSQPYLPLPTPSPLARQACTCSTQPWSLAWGCRRGRCCQRARRRSVSPSDKMTAPFIPASPLACTGRRAGKRPAGSLAEGAQAPPPPAAAPQCGPPTWTAGSSTRSRTRWAATSSTPRTAAIRSSPGELWRSWV